MVRIAFFIISEFHGDEWLNDDFIMLVFSFSRNACKVCSTLHDWLIFEAFYAPPNWKRV